MTIPAAASDPLAIAIARIEARLDAMEKADVVLAAETSRRLEALNHSRERDESKQHTYLLREVFEKSLDETRLWRESVNKGLGMCLRREVYDAEKAEWQKWRNEMDQARAYAAGKWSVIAAIVAASLALIGVIINTVARLHGG